MPNIELPFRKVYPTAAFSGQTPLTDISSPAQGDVIGTGPADSNKYCVTQIAGECRAGSAAGDVYVNAPTWIIRSVTRRLKMQTFQNNTTFASAEALRFATRSFRLA